MYQAEPRDIAIVAGGEAVDARAIVAPAFDLAGSADQRRADQVAPFRGEAEAGLRRVVERDGGVRRRGARKRSVAVVAVVVDAAVDHKLMAAGRHFERQAARMGEMRKVGRWWRRRVGNDRGGAQRQTLIARMRCMQKRCAAGIVVAQDGGDTVVLGDAHAVETGDGTIAVTEEAQCRQHALDGVDECLRGLLRLIGIGLPERQKVGQKFHDRAWIARDMAAVGEYLPVKFLGKIAAGGLDRGGGCRQRQGAECQRDAGAQPVFAIRHFAGVCAQIAHLHGEHLQELAIERKLGALQHDGGMLKPCDEAPGGGARLPRHAGDAPAVERHPFFHQSSGIGGGEVALGGAHVAQPAKTVQGILPWEVVDRSAEG